MKKFLKTFVVLSLNLLCFLPAYGQVNFQSYDPVGDSVVVERMRERMTVVRKQRPTVALVLSGGGAKGAAHVGVLRYLEEQRIPVDMVLGTSMGGLVGGLYAIGYSPDYLDSLLRTTDWELALSDRIPQDMVSYRQKKYREKYFASVPFYHAQKDIFSRNTEQMAYPSDDGLHFGADEAGRRTLRENIFGSLPSGFVFGHNVNNIFSGLTVGYQGYTDFMDLPIPFFCIATEMVSGKAYLWHEGDLNLALRSTMSIPGIFAPVRSDGKIFVDGGMRNNYPADIAREMGADVIIGVELSDKDMTYQEINNLADLAWQAVDIFGRDIFEKNVNIPDIGIKPDLHEFNMMSFTAESVDTIISRGYKAAAEHEAEIQALKRRIGPSVTRFRNEPAIDIENTPVVLSALTFEGVTDDEASYLLDRLSIKPWDKVVKKDLEEAVATILATGSFDFVRYELQGNGDNFDLHIICQKGPVHQAGLGMRFDTETVVSALFNMGFNVHRVRGSAWDFTARISSNPYGSAHYSLRFPKFPTVNVEVDGSRINAGLITPTEPTMPVGDVNLRYRRMSQKLYFSDLNWKRADVRIGVRNDYFNVTSLMAASSIPEEYDKEHLRNDYVVFFAEGRNDTHDYGYFPTKGYNIGGSYQYVVGGLISETDPVHIVQMDGSRVFRVSEELNIIPSFYTRLSLGGKLPIAYMNIMGGDMAGRYMEQQVPFIGINNATPLNDNMLKLDLNFRLHLTTNNWLSLKGSAVKHSSGLNMDLITGDTIFGMGVEYAYNTAMGPLKFNVHYSNLTDRLGAYLSFGYDF